MILEKRRRHISPMPTGHTPGCLSSAIRRTGINSQVAAQGGISSDNQSTKFSKLVRSLILHPPNFRRHPCSDTDSVPLGPELPESLCATDSTASYVMSTGIKIGVYSYVSNVAQEGIVLLGFPPSKTDAVVSLITPVRYSANSSSCTPPPPHLFPVTDELDGFAQFPLQD